MAAEDSSHGDAAIMLLRALAACALVIVAGVRLAAKRGAGPSADLLEKDRTMKQLQSAAGQVIGTAGKDTSIQLTAAQKANGSNGCASSGHPHRPSGRPADALP